MEQEFKLKLIDVTTNYDKRDNNFMISNAIVSNDRIALFWLNSENQNIADNNMKIFNIILKRTNEIVGIIAYDLEMNGEILYNIYPQYRNNHYATDALNLVKKLIWHIYKENSPDLYIVALNKISEKVAINNGGILLEDSLKSPDDPNFSFKAPHYIIKMRTKN